MITMSINKKKWFSALGVPFSDMDAYVPLLENIERQILDVAMARGTYKVLDISKNSSETVEFLNSSVSIKGFSLSRHLLNCKKAAFVAVTLGGEVDKLINKLQLTNINYGYIADAGASILIEEYLTLYIKDISRFITLPFSPGYGDFSLEYQPYFIELLECEKKIGLTVNESNLLLPRKSITAIVGIGNQPVTGSLSTCHLCQIKEKCKLRKKGEKCYE